jgi:hypothetical protein
MASGFVGSNFDSTVSGNFGASGSSSASVDFGGQLAYLWRGVVGGEFLADWGPNFNIDSLFLADKPRVDAYMANVIGALPLGSTAQFVPYVSGGWGTIAMRSTVFTVDPTINLLANSISLSTSDQTQRRSGSDFGGGIMIFGGKIGFRGDVRHYRASTNNQINASTLPELVSEQLLSDLKFWRANAGVAFRW